MKVKFAILLAFIGSCWLISCEKQEQPITLPPKGSAEIDRVDMGEDYDKQIFYDLESRKIIKTSSVNSWDLSFETAPDGYHVFVNGGRNIFVFNTHKSNAADIAPNYEYTIADNQYKFDSPTGLPDSTAIGEWRNVNSVSNKEVYLLRFYPDVYKKIILKSVSATQYELMYGDLGATELKTIIIPKDPTYSFSYFSFDNGGSVVMPDPPKTDWDIVFTRYRYIYYSLNNFPYLVSGVLSNPYNTWVSPDSVNNFTAINAPAPPNTYTNKRDVIGFDWKNYNFDNGRYEVRKEKNYIIRTQENAEWKLHFLDFYSTTGMKGSPMFEFERIR